LVLNQGPVSSIHDPNFQNEGKEIAGLNHENIVNIYDIEEHSRTLFIIVEHVMDRSMNNNDFMRAPGRKEYSDDNMS
jgi:hypothetical protein